MAINWYTVKPFTNSVTQSWIDIGHGVDFKIISNTMHLRHWTSPLSEKLKHIYTYLPLLTGHYSWLFRIRKQQITVIRASTIHFTSHQSPKNVRFSSSRLHHYHFEFLTSCVQTGAKFSSSLVTATELSEMRGASLVWIPLSNAAIKTQLQLLLHRKNLRFTTHVRTRQQRRSSNEQAGVMSTDLLRWIFWKPVSFSNLISHRRLFLMFVLRHQRYNFPSFDGQWSKHRRHRHKKCYRDICASIIL